MASQEAEQLRLLGVNAVDAQQISQQASALIDTAEAVSRQAQQRRLVLPRKRRASQADELEDGEIVPSVSSSSARPSSSVAPVSQPLAQTREVRLLQQQEQLQTARMNMISGGDYTPFSGQNQERKISIVERPRLPVKRRRVEDDMPALEPDPFSPPPDASSSSSSSEPVDPPPAAAAEAEPFQPPQPASKVAQPQRSQPSREVIDLLDDSDESTSSESSDSPRSKRQLRRRKRKQESSEDELPQPDRLLDDESDEDSVNNGPMMTEIDDLVDQHYWLRQCRYLSQRMRSERAQWSEMPALEGPSMPTANVTSDVRFDGDLRCPPVLWNELFGHQRTCLKWMWELVTQRLGGILADEMGSVVVHVLSFAHCLQSRQDDPIAGTPRQSPPFYSLPARRCARSRSADPARGHPATSPYHLPVLSTAPVAPRSASVVPSASVDDHARELFTTGEQYTKTSPTIETAVFRCGYPSQIFFNSSRCARQSRRLVADVRSSASSRHAAH